MGDETDQLPRPRMRTVIVASFAHKIAAMQVRIFNKPIVADWLATAAANW